ncbi:hypothetical protein Patl1_15450 [Pistacia atlantica]|uniref:Uncharacterized protein n=1 Tax=Pistacia atlantica TaxID=434234 RepID=A0ACC1BAL9_9ROSI|nr:hypothetical protein Patl1_15450 [Pistacia atlantica]
MVGALQDVRSNLTELRVLFYKVLEDLDAHLYNKGEYREKYSRAIKILQYKWHQVLIPSSLPPSLRCPQNCNGGASLLFSKFLFWWKQRHWICCLVTHSLILF